MAKTAVQNSQVITLQPTGVASSVSLNPIFIACDPTNGNFFTASGRDMMTFFCLPSEDAPAWSAAVNYTAGQVVNFAGESDSITNISITTNVLTVTAVNTFTVGVPVTLSGLTTATFLNNQIVVVISTTGTSFTATFAHADYASAPDTGSAHIASGVFIAVAASGTNAGGARQPNTPAYWGVYVDGSSTVTFLSAPDACTGRKSDIVNYPIPVPTNTPLPAPNNGGTVQFQILPSSVFTQTDGSIQFTASSNLVLVNVSSL
jgi:hypothetical protein